MTSWRVEHGDCIALMAAMPEASVDAIVCDPPFALSFMSKSWDSFGALAFQEWCEAWAREALRVLKPGGHILAAGSTRTSHRLVCGLEDAGFEIRDTIVWLHGQGFPKSHDVSRAIDKAAGAEREVIGQRTDGRYASGFSDAAKAALGKRVSDEQDDGQFAGEMGQITVPATPDAERWAGWGTALKPACEFWTLARKPLSGNVAQNVLAHGTGALNIDACRIGMSAEDLAKTTRSGDYGETNPGAVGFTKTAMRTSIEPSGRWPANVVLDEGAAAILDEQTGTLTSGSGQLNRNADKFRTTYGEFKGGNEPADVLYGDSGGASKFFATFSACGDESTEGASTSGGVSPEAGESTPSSITDGSGNSATDPSHLDMTSITRTRTRSTTSSRTSNSSKSPDTKPTTEPSELPELNATDSDSAPDAGGGSPSTTMPSDRAGSAKGTANRVSANTSESGEPVTASDTTPTCAPIEHGTTERFLYCAKASSAERHGGGKNNHPTVKPVELMRWLCRLVTPPGGTILDPFTGSGTTGIAALREGFSFVGIEQDAGYVDIARARIIGDAPLINSASEVAA